MRRLMQMKQRVTNLSKTTRRWRRVHHYAGLSLAFFLAVSAITGIFLGWKKNSDTIQPPTLTGVTTNMEQWLPLTQLEDLASGEVNKRKIDATLDRIDVRPDKGILKFQYTPGFWEVQVDGQTGKILSVEKRYSDLIEQIHDGSIISDGVKLVSMNLLGIGLCIMIFSGLWLWYGPNKIRRIKHL